MKPTIGVACIGQIGREIERAIQTLSLNATFIFSDTLIKDESRLPAELEKADVLLSSGYLAKVLRAITDKPVIKIEPSLFDILTVYSRESRRTSLTKYVIILPSENSTRQLEQLQNILSFKVVVDHYEKLTDIDGLLDKYRERGYQYVVGSGLVCERAEANGMKGLFVYPQESLRSFIRLAHETAVSINRQTETREQLETIFSRSSSGIILADPNGIISMCNDRASQIIPHGNASMAGRSCSEFFPEKDLHTVINKQISLNHVLCVFDGKRYLASIVPILASGTLHNIMISLDDIGHIRSQEQHIRKALASNGYVATHRFIQMTTHNAAFQNLINKAKKYARSDECITILGETGTGKEVLCQSIHNYSDRADQPFVAVNCSALNENLLESELFGYEEGAFTGARKGGKEGYFEVANGGTIFLDEIGEMSLPLQSKLLRAVQEKQLIRVGGNKIIRFDARIIVATNRNLWQEVQEHRFREDLYYRLAVLELKLPPLRERREDIVPLFLSFIARQDSRFAEIIRQNSRELEEILLSHSWPGNVRELENFVKAILVAWDYENPPEQFIAFVEAELGERKLARRQEEHEAAGGSTDTHHHLGLADAASGTGTRATSVDSNAQGSAHEAGIGDAGVFAGDSGARSTDIGAASKDVTGLSEKDGGIGSSGRMDTDDPGATPSGGSGEPGESGGISLRQQLAENERQRILAAMTEAGNNVTKAAELLGISRTTLWRRMKKY